MKRLYLSLTLIFMLIAQYSFAISFKNNSVLADGKWVKIKVEESGIYELSYQQLKDFGFENPENVKVFGTGGNVASENYLYEYMDDLEQNPVMHHSDKIYFYGKGVVKDSLSVINSSYIYRPVTNPYSQYGVYFLSDMSSEAPLLIEDVDYSSGVEAVSSCRDISTAVWFDEKELYNPGMTGQNFLGDNYALEKSITYNVPVPEIADDGTLYAVAANALESSGTMNVFLSANGIDMDDSGHTLPKNSDIDYLDYGNLTVRANADAANLQADNDVLDLNIRIETDGNLTKALVDYVSVSYPAYNRLPSGLSQTRRYVSLSTDSGIKVYPSSDGFRVWKVDEFKANSEKPFKVENCLMADNGDGSSSFIDGKSLSWAEYIFFDVEREQLHPEYIGEISNQNLHSIAVPDMLIITNSDLINQAERLADYHRQYDGMDVAVVDQELVFNEFSSGVRDAMAYRRFCKMLYDRDSKKFKYLLLFGSGTYDNRMIYAEDNTKQLITYQSKASYSQVQSYSTDDFFGFLDDSNTSYTTRQMQISVGRIPFSTELEMKEYIDKLIAYMKDVNTVGSAWKNNILLIGENGDDDVHVSQCESFMHYLSDTGTYDMSFTKLYLKAFDDTKTVRTKFVEQMNSGQNFVLFVGHGHPTAMTKTQEIMTLDKARETHYRHAPIMYFSTCDVARYDRGGSNLVESLLINAEGGIISAIASTRVVYTNLNGKLSDAFAKSLAKSNEYYGGEKTLGKVLQDAKNTCGERTINRLKYHLLGDPAMRIDFPENQVSLSMVNDTELSGDNSIDVAVMEPIEFKGVVNDENGEIDSEFDGKAIVRLYDSDKLYTTAKVTINNVISENENLYQRGALLNEAVLDIAKGEFSGNIVLPEFSDAEGAKPIRIIAVSDEGEILSGSCSAVSADRNLLPTTLPDLKSPEIDAFYINDKETFKDGMVVAQDFNIYAEISDNFGINNSYESITSSMRISFDNGKTVKSVNGSYIPVSNNAGVIEMPVYDMEPGRHTAELTVVDLSGNVSNRVLSFYVENSAEDLFMALSDKASSNSVEINLDTLDSDLSDYSNAEIFVADDNGNILFRDTCDSIPYEWNLTGSDGNKLKPGVYNITVSVDGYSLKSEKFVVLEQ